MRRGFRIAGVVLATMLGTTVVGACGDGEDRPGAVTSDDKGGPGSGSASASADPSGSGTHTGSHMGGAEASFSKDEADVPVDVIAKDFRFEGIPPTIEGRKIFFTVENTGAAEHEFDVKGHGEIEPFEPGETETLALELEPGEYTVACLVKEGNMTHEQMGMTATFTVTAPAA